MKVYLASSWRNPTQPLAVTMMRQWGHDVYDFRNPTGTPGVDTGFSWSNIDKDWQNWTPDEYIDALRHPNAEAGFLADFNAMKWCDACVMLMPCGSSAHLELGWAAGAGKHTAVIVQGDREPELMVKVADEMFLSIDGACLWLDDIERFPPQPTINACRACGCTDTTACIDFDGQPCHWAEPDLCSKCDKKQKAL